MKSAKQEVSAGGTDEISPVDGAHSNAWTVDVIMAGTVAHVSVAAADLQVCG